MGPLLVLTAVSAASVSFTSAREGFVLGTAPCAHKPCTVVLHTRDRGATWARSAAPREAVSRFDGRGLWGIRFADPRRGFAFGRGMWTTNDGGASWRRVRPPAKFVFGLQVVAHRRVLAIATNGVAAPDLYTRPLAGRRWRRIRNAKPLGTAQAIAVHGRTAWVALGAELLVSTDAGASWTIEPTPCTGARTAASLADDGRHTYLLCIGQGFTGHTLKYLYRTTGTRLPWKLVGRPPAAGDGGLLAAGSDRALVIATASAASWLYRSTDAGRRWHTALFYGDGGEGWADLVFTTPTEGAVIHGPAQKDGGSSNFPGRLLLTDDGGQHWRAVSF